MDVFQPVILSNTESVVDMNNGDLGLNLEDKKIYLKIFDKISMFGGLTKSEIIQIIREEILNYDLDVNWSTLAQ